MKCRKPTELNDAAHLAPDFESRLPKARAHAARYLRASAREFFERSLSWRNQVTELAIEAGRTRYDTPKPALGEVCRICRVLLVTGAGEEYPISEHTELDRDPETLEWFSPVPQQFVLSREAPSEVVLARFDLALCPRDEDHLVLPELLSRHREAIIDGALYRGCIAKGLDSEDANRAAFYLGRFEEAVARELREPVDPYRAPMSRRLAMRMTKGSRRRHDRWGRRPW